LFFAIIVSKSRVCAHQDLHLTPSSRKCKKKKIYGIV